MRTQGPRIKPEKREVAVTGAYGEHASVRRPRLRSKGSDRRRDKRREKRENVREGSNRKREEMRRGNNK